MRSTLAVTALTAVIGGCSPSHTDPPPNDGGADAAPAPIEWAPVLEQLDGSLLSIWGTSERDVWTVGGPLGNSGFESLVMRFDGTVWRRLKPGGTETFWWVHGTGTNDVWLVGEKGRITHWDGTKFEERPSGTTATIFGVWAAAPNDAWAVGGLPEQPAGDNDVVLHWDGTSWKPEVLPEKKNVALFKVWGVSKDDLYIVGETGLVWHRTNGTWKREAEGVAKGRLTTVTGCSATEIIAVGGRDLVTSAGAAAWKRSDAVLVNDINGVSCAPPGTPVRAWGRAVVVGGGSLKLRLVGNTWESDFGAKPFADLHGAWVDPTGAFWGVGGDFSTSPRAGASRAGVVAHYGPTKIPSTIEK